MQSNDIPPVNPPPPPPPPAQRSRLRLWIGIGAGAVVVVLCFAAVAALAWAKRDQLGLTRLFPSAGVQYLNPAMGIKLEYPTDWVYQEGTGAVMFATSKENLNLNVPPTTGGGMAVFKSPAADMGLPSNIDLTSPESILKAFVDASFATGIQTQEAAHAYKLGAYLVASTVLLVDTGGASQMATYITIFVYKGDVVLALGFTPENEWAQFRPVFDRMLRSLSFSS
jgi:hypothetical protein